MPDFESPVVEELWNHFHSPKTGQFASGGRYKSGAGKGLFSIARTSKRGPKRSLLGFKPHARQSFSTPFLEEFYNHVHDTATGRFSGRAASGRAGFREGSHTGPGRSVTHTAKKGAMETVPRMFSPKNVTTRKFTTHTTHAHSVGGKATPEGFPRPSRATRWVSKLTQHVPKGTAASTSKTTGGKPVVGAKAPLRDSVTGRINPTQVRAAFKQSPKQNAGGKSAGVKKTELIGGKPTTHTTYRGRKIQHVSSKGGADRAGFREGSPGTGHKRTVKGQRDLLKEAIARTKKK